METYDTHWDLEKIFDTVRLLRNHWDRRDSNMEFYTLGKTVYLDGNTPDYYSCQAGVNQILLKHFNFMYEDLKEMLATILGEPVFFNHDIALPGFHVFPSDPQFLSMYGPWHVDLPHNTLGLGDKDTQAYTVAIKLPTGGGGMDMQINGKEKYVNLNYDESKKKLIINGSSYKGEANIDCVIGNWWNHKVLKAKQQISPLSGSIKDQVVKFIGDDSEINLNTKHPEFIEWKWLDYNLLPEVIVDFKKEVYKKLKNELKNFIN